MNKIILNWRGVQLNKFKQMVVRLNQFKVTKEWGPK